MAPIKNNFATGAARASLSHAPEIILLTQANYALGRYAYFISPDLGSLVIVLIDRSDKLLGGQFDYLGQKLPGQANSLIFKIITERKITQHFEKSMVPGSPSHGI